MKSLEDKRFPLPKVDGVDEDDVLVSTIRVIIEGKLGQKQASSVKNAMADMVVAALENAGGEGYTNELVSDRPDATAITVFVFGDDGDIGGAENAFDSIGSASAEMIEALTGLSCRGGTL